MKKLVLFFMVALIAAGAVWGQVVPPVFFGVNDLESAYEKVEMGKFFVDKTVSTEKRYSAGIFSSYADDFIWFTGYDQKVGNFLLLGGYPSQEASTVEDTDNLATTPYTLNFGYGKSLKSGGYLGVYYGGNIVNASGTNNGLEKEDNAITSTSTWTNRLAILYGNEKIGGIRFDLLFEDTQYDENYVDGKPRGNPAQTVREAPRIAVGWGKTLAKETEFYVQLGYKFAELTVITDVDGKKKDTIWGGVTITQNPPLPPSITIDSEGNAKLALQAGIYKPLAKKDNTESSFSVDFLIGNIFGAQGEGDYLLEKGKFVQGGIFLLGADVGIKSVTTVGKFSFGFKPNVELGFVVNDTNSFLQGSEKTFDALKVVFFELKPGVNFGIKYQFNQKFSLYSGVGLTIIDLQAGGYSEGKDQKYVKDDLSTLGYKSSAWKIDGLSWKNETLTTGGNLGFGLTYAPNKNIVIGAGLNALLDKIITFNLRDMTASTVLNRSGSGSELEWIANNTISGLNLDLTISAKF